MNSKRISYKYPIHTFLFLSKADRELKWIRTRVAVFIYLKCQKISSSDRLIFFVSRVLVLAWSRCWCSTAVVFAPKNSVQSFSLAQLSSGRLNSNTNRGQDILMFSFYLLLLLV